MASRDCFLFYCTHIHLMNAIRRILMHKRLFCGSPFFKSTLILNSIDANIARFDAQHFLTCPCKKLNTIQIFKKQCIIVYLKSPQKSCRDWPIVTKITVWKGKKTDRKRCHFWICRKNIIGQIPKQAPFKKEELSKSDVCMDIDKIIIIIKDYMTSFIRGLLKI